MRFHDRSVSFFGKKTQEHVKTIKKRCLEVKHDIFRKDEFERKKGCAFPELFPLFKGPGRAHTLFNGPCRVHMGPYEPTWAHMGPYGPIWAYMGIISRENADQLFQLINQVY